MTHPNHPSVDQSDRVVPYNLRQSGRTPVQLLISTRVRKSPFWHLSIEAGCWRATTYNRIYHPRGYVKPEDGGMMAEYDALVNRVTMWNVAVERQIRIKKGKVIGVALDVDGWQGYFPLAHPGGGNFDEKVFKRHLY